MGNIIRKIIIILNLIVIIKANAQTINLEQEPEASTKISLNSTEQKRILKKMYHKNGQIKEIRETINGNLDGKWKLFYNNGQLKKEGYFKNNEPDGTWKVYANNGILLFIENYSNGIEHGEWNAFYKSGDIKIKGSFEKGKRQGKWSVYNDKGLVKSTIVFQDDKKKSELVFNNEPITPINNHIISTVD